MVNKSSNVVIFRKRILPYSETFIADQGRFLSDYQAVFTGFYLDQSGLDLVSGKPRLVLEEYSDYKEFAKMLFRTGFPVKNRWIASLKEIHARLVHAHFLNDGIDAVQLGRTLEIPVLTTLHGHDITKREGKSFFKKDSQFLFQHVNRVIAVSNYIAEHALRKGCPEHKLIRHSIGIDLDRFQQQKNESDIPSLLFVGRLVEKKRL